MKIKAVLFDLDGTLLPMDQDSFIKTYFGLLARKLAPYGYETEKLVSSIWDGTKTMVENDGSKSNEEAFWDKFAQIYGEQVREDMPYFEEYYEQDFDKVQRSCGFNKKAREVIDEIKSISLRIILATNPIFPSIATRKRIGWAGLTPEDFEFFTAYENSRHCKPNLEYYKDILAKARLKPEECLMVGNDVDEDMIAQKLGMKVFLLTDCLINKNQTDISVYPNGSFDKLIYYVHQLQI